MLRRGATILLTLGACGAPAPRAEVTPAAEPAPVAAPAHVAVTVAPPAPPPPAPAPTPEVRFLAVGDVMLSRGVAQAIADHDDLQWPFRPLAERFAAVDFTFANLESPFAAKTVVPLFGNVFNAPRSHVEGLVTHRFEVLNLANNHAMDQGYRGLLDTLAWVRAHDRVAFGAGRTVDEAWAPGVIEVRGIRVGFLGASYCSVNDHGDTWLPYVARIQDEGRLAKALAELKREVDFTVVTMHAGVEYASRPFSLQHRFVAAAVEAGADLVVGAHPHVVQPAERVDGVWVFYSLGNFIFDLGERRGDEGAALDITLTRRPEGVVITGLEVVPVVIADGAPRLAEGARARGIVQRMGIDRTTLVPEN